VLPFLDALGPAVAAARWRVAPIAIVGQARVAIGDEVGELLGARLVVVLIGERPGLSSPDSMGIYLTWNPAIGTNDAARNCISNVRPEGLSPVHAAEKLVYLLGEAMRRRLTGVALKDELAAPVPSLPGRNGNFLTGPD
jgi:ethanolamine ammonia-lyase small subunit